MKSLLKAVQRSWIRGTPIQMRHTLSTLFITPRINFERPENTVTEVTCLALLYRSSTRKTRYLFFRRAYEESRNKPERMKPAGTLRCSSLSFESMKCVLKISIKVA